MNVLAASPLYPFFNATKSTLTISPFFMYLFFDGTPCITSSFIDIHVAAGYGWVLLLFLDHILFLLILLHFFSLVLLQFDQYQLLSFLVLLFLLLLCELMLLLFQASLINSISFLILLLPFFFLHIILEFLFKSFKERYKIIFFLLAIILFQFLLITSSAASFPILFIDILTVSVS